ncbi:uncharacterized protein LOC108452371 isoform X2 [Gossypium arboreum]|uniref:uncharacterized protein LOC108452371 isoform X2 n=1 Tax=Gossypium arboreum TaxID=29729 RepID=UPI0008196E42|nr:uncharacterized protein LOC108452371 isoform X2 [Gossypium arboreum]
MESILARALEYTLKYWLKSFSRDQFKLQGRTGQLSNLDINGDALHASMGLPLALTVTTAKIGKLEIILPKVKNVQVDPIVLQIDRLDMVLEENPDVDTTSSSNNLQSPTSSGKGSGYGFADKISDGMTLQFQTVNLLLETSGGAWFEGGAAWATPMASITMRNLLLYTTNENWQVVNLKAARDFSSNKNLIYVFRKLEWESLSIDLLPHPDMFSDARLARPRVEAAQRDDDGAKRITVQRTELNSPLGLEVQLHVTEVVCPALSEPGLRALLRFLTGLCVCLNRGDVDLKAQERSVESAGHSLVSLVVDHVFLCVKDPEFRLELLMQSLHFSRASVSDGESSRNLSKVMIGGLFLRDTFSRPPCTLVQPSMKAVTDSHLLTPKFGENFCPPIYPLGKQEWQLPVGVPLISLHSLQVKPSPPPPSFASRTVISYQPLLIHLQEESCLRIYSFLADGIIGDPDSVSPDSSVNSFVFTLKELDISVPLHTSKIDNSGGEEDHAQQNSFAGARLHFEKLFFCESPSLNLKLLNLEKDPACLSVWDGQPVDASLIKWTAEVSQVSLLLEPTACSTGSPDWSSDLWKCVEVKDVCIELAMASTDGNPLTVLPPPGGIVRIAVACPQFLSNSSVEQFIFVLDLYAYIGRVSEKISVVGKNKRPKRNKDDTLGGRLIEKVPSDTAVSLAITVLQLRFLEACSLDMQGMPLAQFTGNNLFLKATHRTLGGAIAVSSTLRWESVQVDCVSTEGNIVYDNNNTQIDATKNGSLATENGFSPLRAIFWIHNKQKQLSSPKASVIPFLDISTVHVIPFNERDKECHTLSVSACGTLGGVKDDSFSHLGIPDDVDASIELQDWLFALEGVQEMAEMWWFEKEDLGREHRCWHMTFQSLTVKAKSSSKDVQNVKKKSHGMRRYPVEFILVSMEGLQTLKPQVEWSSILEDPLPVNGFKESVSIFGRMNLEVRMKILEDKVDNETVNWMMENFKFSVKQPIEAVLTKDELQHLAFLCKSEVDSIGRLTAGILRLLKLEKSLGKEAMNKLSNLGIDGFEKIFSSDKLSQGSKLQSITTLALLEEAVSDSQAKCAALITESSNLESSQVNLTNIKELKQKLDNMHSLLLQLRVQI